MILRPQVTFFASANHKLGMPNRDFRPRLLAADHRQLEFHGSLPNATRLNGLAYSDITGPQNG
jgi:hypothetical protein